MALNHPEAAGAAPRVLNLMRTISSPDAVRTVSSREPAGIGRMIDTIAFKANINAPTNSWDRNGCALPEEVAEQQ